MLRVMVILCTLIFLIVPPAEAEVYRCIDRQTGRSAFQDRPCPSSHETDADFKAPAARPKSGPVVIHLERKASGYWLDATLNGVTIVQFLLDTGANMVTVPRPYFDQLERAGTITSSEKGLAMPVMLADGSRRNFQRFLLRTVQIGPITIERVAASRTDAGSPPLLGSNVLDQLGTWRIDKTRSALIVER